MSGKLKALIVTPIGGGVALLVCLAFGSAMTGTDQGTTLFKTIIPMVIAAATVIIVIVEALVM
jgi:hypothetical protein